MFTNVIKKTKQLLEDYSLRLYIYTNKITNKIYIKIKININILKIYINNFKINKFYLFLNILKLTKFIIKHI